MQRKQIAIVVSLLISMNSFAQSVEKREQPAEEELKGTHRLSLLIGHSNLSEGIKDNGKRGWKVIPSWGIDYDYWISNHWAIGLQNDIMIETFEVEDHEHQTIERTRPFSSIASVLFKPKEHFTFAAGAGGEFAKEGSFFVTRLGIESGWEIKKNWEFGISLAYDIKWNGYDTYVFAFRISKLLRKHREEH